MTVPYKMYSVDLGTWGHIAQMVRASNLDLETGVRFPDVSLAA